MTKSAATNGEGEGEEDEEMEGDQENNEKTKQSNNETSTPWVSLASLALFKLFNDWQAQVTYFPWVVMHCFNRQPGEGIQIGPNWDLSKALNNRYRLLLLRILGFYLLKYTFWFLWL